MTRLLDLTRRKLFVGLMESPEDVANPVRNAVDMLEDGYVMTDKGPVQQNIICIKDGS